MKIGDIMKCKNLINLLGKFNEQNIIASINLKPEKIIFMYDDEKCFDEFNTIKKYLKNKGSKAEIQGVFISKVNSDNIMQCIEKLEPNDTIINLSSGEKLMSLFTYNIAEKIGIKTIYVDTEEKFILDISNGNVKKMDIELHDLNIKDFVKITGGKIVYHSTDMFDIPNVQEFIDTIISNYELWNILKKVIVKGKSIENNLGELEKVSIDFNNYEMDDINKSKVILEKFKKLNLLNFNNENKNKLSIKFPNPKMKTLFLKTGTWLEILVYKTLKEIKEIDDIKGGVIFLWDDDDKYVKNEIDVLAALDSKLICISCKDTSKYDVSALNELEVYGGKLGSSVVKKILVATKEPYKKSTISRAEEMGIDIIVFNGDTRKLKEDLKRSIINKK